MYIPRMAADMMNQSGFHKVRTNKSVLRQFLCKYAEKYLINTELCFKKVSKVTKWLFVEIAESIGEEEKKGRNTPVTTMHVVGAVPPYIL